MSADISMCGGRGCPLRDTCYRHTAKPDPHWQSYIGAPYKDGECTHYWPLPVERNTGGLGNTDVKRKTPPTECADKPQTVGPTDKERQV